MRFGVALIRYDRHAADRIDGAPNSAVTPMWVFTVPSVPMHHVCAAAESHHEVEETSKQQKRE
jgi:hypothetical protein